MGEPPSVRMLVLATADRTERRLTSLGQLVLFRANFLAGSVKKLALLVAINELGRQN
jgi:hypothetical protein